MTAIPVITLADILSRVESDEALSATRRRDLASDLRCLARFLERDLQALPAEFRALKRALEAIHHARVGVSRKRLQNLRSSLRFVLDRYRAASPPKEPLSPMWQALYDRLEGPRERRGMARLCRYCSALGIAPQDVSEGVTADWRHWLEESTLCRKPGALHRQACRIWNEVGDRGVLAPDGTPLPQLAVPDNPSPSSSLTWSEFPGAFVEEVEQFGQWLSGRDLFAEHPPARPCKPSTIDLNKQHIRLLASAAVQQGFPLTELTGLRALVSQACVRCALEHYHAKTDSAYTTYHRDLTKTLLRIARRWVRDDEQADWIAERLRRMGTNTTGLTAKNRNTLRQFDDPDNVGRLLNLPGRLMAEADAGQLTAPRCAVRAQLAVAIELLLLAPMRLGNLASLRIDDNLTWVGRGAKRHCFISVHEDTVKNGMPLEFPIPPASAAMLAHYLERHRPLLVEGDEPWLFPGKAKAGASHSHKLGHTLGEQLKKVISAETGVHLTPHQFRHVAAKLYLDRHPGNYEVVRQLLGHKSTKTTVAFYTGLETRAAAMHYDETLAGLRRDHPPARRKK